MFSAEMDLEVETWEDLENSLPTRMVTRCFLVCTFTIDRRLWSGDRLPALTPTSFRSNDYIIPSAVAIALFGRAWRLAIRQLHVPPRRYITS